MYDDAAERDSVSSDHCFYRSDMNSRLVWIKKVEDNNRTKKPIKKYRKSYYSSSKAREEPAQDHFLPPSNSSQMNFELVFNWKSFGCIENCMDRN